MKKWIDLYHGDSVSSWADIASDGIVGVFLKASEGITEQDEMFGPRVAFTAMHNIQSIPYHFFIPTDNGQAQAENFTSVPKVTGPSMALDLESVMENDIEQWGVLPEQQRYDQLQSFLSFITAKGFTDIIIYSTKDFIDTYLPNATFLAQYKLWLAEYAPQVNGLPKFWTKWNYWQYTDRGIVGGVPEPIDCSYENEEV